MMMKPVRGLAAWIAVVMLAVALGVPSIAWAEEAAARPADSKEVPADFLLVAENERFQLFLQQEKTQFILRERRDGTLWRTNPDLTGRNLQMNDLWKEHMASQFILNYSDGRKRHVKSTNNVHEKAVVSYVPIDGGVRATFQLDALKMQIAIEYVLGPDYLQVRIPDNLIQENGEFIIVSLELTPFFEAGFDNDQGYLFLPDGGGAISRFKTEHPRYSRQFSEYVFGADEFSFAPGFIVEVIRGGAENVINMPVFGVVRNDHGFVGIISEGEFNAKVNAAPSGYIVELSRAGAEFIFRKQYQAPISRWNRVTTIQSERVKADRAVQYYPLLGNEASYVGMANVYREYLREKYGIQGRFQQAMQDGAAPLHLRIMQSVIKEGLVLDELVVMTTFGEAQQMLEALIKAGIKNIDVTLVGWGPRGYQGVLPNRLPPEPALGGAAGLRQLTDFAAENGITLMLEDNYLDAWARNGGFSARNDVIRDASRLQVNGWGGHFLLSPVVAYHKFAMRDIPRMAELGVDGLDLENFGKVVLSDNNRVYPATRAQFAQTWLAIAELAKQKLGQVAVQGGNTYLLKVADKVTDVPMDESELVFVDESIPFYPIVVHGLVPYYGWPTNLRSDPRREFLKIVEYGALPSFELTWQDSSLLRLTRYNILFSSQYTTWLDRALDEYRQLGVELGYLQPQAIVGHSQLAPEVTQTVYEDGSRVVVNYTNAPFLLPGGAAVKPLDYLLVKGKGVK